MTAALWAAVFLFIAFTLPPATRDAQGFIVGHVRRGAFHVHTAASDGGGTREDVARAAAEAGLDFVILTDHGDGTAAPAPPAYLHHVLIIDGVEVTTSAGHYATFGAARAPYPLGGPPYAVIEDIARLGGFGVAAHPESARADLRWRDWNARIDGFEWINGDSAWRDEGAMTLARGLIDYLFRPGPALAGLVERPSRLLARLDDSSRTRRVVALAGADAHARLPLTSDEEPHRSGWTVPAPSYKQSFGAFANLVDSGAPISGDAATDAAALTRAIREGRVAFAMTSLAQPSEVFFAATGGTGGARVRHPMGAIVAPGPLTFDARTSDVGDDGASLVRMALYRDGRVVARAEGPVLTHHAEDAQAARGVWRIEATLAHRPDVPWLLTNPIVVREMAAGGEPATYDPRPAASGEAAGGQQAGAAQSQPQQDAAPLIERTLDLSAGTWVVEKHPRSEAAIATDGAAPRMTYELAGGEPAGQFAAAVRATDNTEAWDAVVLTARADAPTRLWIQLRLSDSRTGQRWGRSVYLDQTSRTVRIPIRDFAALEPRASASRPTVAQVRAVLIVVDTVNSAPGRAGEVVIERLRLERGR